MTAHAGAATAPQRVIILGDVMTDIVARLATPIAPGSDTLAAISTHGGGSGANQATWLATVAPQFDIHFIGAVGDDHFGYAQREAFASAGVTPHLARDPSRPTGTVIALVDATGERSMITERGANAGLSPSDLPQHLFLLGAWLHISGYTLLSDDTRPTALAAIRLARKHSMGISVDPASEAMLLAAGVEHFLAWTDGLSLCFPNLDEGRLLTGATDPQAIATTLCAHYDTVALKLGADGALLAHRGELVARQACVPTTALDSTGAGDAFCAGFLSALLAGRSPHEALVAAVRLAAVAVAQPGARPAGADLQVKH
jgi:sugar/nucleoside kinase (ribokinase family)